MIRDSEQTSPSTSIRAKLKHEFDGALVFGFCGASRFSVHALAERAASEGHPV